MRRVALINSNTSHGITADMLEIPRASAAGQVRIDGLTARAGAPLITSQAELDQAAGAVLDLAPEITADAAIVAAFGDPAVASLARLLKRPVVGIAAASMRAAAHGGRRFAVVTTTPGLRQRIAQRAAELGLAAFCVGVLTTDADAALLLRSTRELECRLHELAARAINALGAQAVIVGGGPLGRLARGLGRKLDAPVIEPIPEAVRQVARILGVNLGSRH